MTQSLMKMSPQQVATHLRSHGVKKAYILTEKHSGGKTEVTISHPVLDPLRELFLKDTRDYRQHEGAFFQVSKVGDFLLSAFVHNTQRGQAQGGTRFWTYSTFEDYVRDGLRLSLGMTRKNALAGLWWGGGKGVISVDPQADLKNEALRRKLFSEYGEFVSSLNGCYITAKDVGTHNEDVASIFTQTRFVTCIPPGFGGSGDPSDATSLGTLRGMEAALESLKLGSLKGKSVSIQGCGSVGENLIRHLLEAGVSRIIATDIFPEVVAKVTKVFSGKPVEVYLSDRNDFSIFEKASDIFSPCATGAILNPTTLGKLKPKIICGAANNQLEDPIRDDKLLFEKGYTYVPDYLVNRMGIVQCANEQYGRLPEDSLITRHLDKEWEYSIYQMTLKTLARSKSQNRPSGLCADDLADELATKPHPLFGHRGREIIQGLKRISWA